MGWAVVVMRIGTARKCLADTGCTLSVDHALHGKRRVVPIISTKREGIAEKTKTKAPLPLVLPVPCLKHGAAFKQRRREGSTPNPTRN